MLGKCKKQASTPSRKEVKAPTSWINSKTMEDLRVKQGPEQGGGPRAPSPSSYRLVPHQPLLRWLMGVWQLIATMGDPDQS